MEFYHYSVELPFSKKVIVFREFTTDEQLSLGKAQYSFSDDYKNYFSFVYSIISKCVRDETLLQNLDIVEYILFLIKIRIISVGQKIELNTEIEGKSAKITLDLNILMNNIFKAVESPSLTFSHKTTKIQIGFPYTKDLPEFFSIAHDANSIINTVPLFIKDINFLQPKNMSSVDRKRVFDKLPVSLSNQIQSHVFEMLKSLSDKEIFGIEIFKDFKINLYNNSFFELVKLVCSYDVKSIHQEIYVLSNLNPLYIRTISPSERKIYLSLYLQEKSPKSDSGSDKDYQQPTRTGNPVDDLALEFGQTPISSSNYE